MKTLERVSKHYYYIIRGVCYREFRLCNHGKRNNIISYRRHERRNLKSVRLTPYSLRFLTYTFVPPKSDGQPFEPPVAVVFHFLLLRFLICKKIKPPIMKTSKAIAIITFIMLPPCYASYSFLQELSRKPQYRLPKYLRSSAKGCPEHCHRLSAEHGFFHCAF